MDNPIILSIIIPYTSSDDGLYHTLNSIPPEDYSAIEMILVQIDGCPLSHLIPESFQVLRLSNPHGNWTQAVETGIQKASGNLTVIFQPGAQLLPGCLKEITTIFSQNPNLNILIGRTICQDAAGNELGLEYPAVFRDHFNLLKIWQNDPPPLSALFFRTQLFNKLICPKMEVPEWWQKYNLLCCITQYEEVFRSNSYLTASPLLPDDLLLTRPQEIEIGIKVSRQYWRINHPARYGLLFLSLLHFRINWKSRALSLLQQAKEYSKQRKQLSALVQFLAASIMAPQIVFTTWVFPYFRDRFLRKIFKLFSV